MSAIDRYDLAVVGSGEAGKYLAWTLSKAGHRTALVERSMVGGSCPNVACLPSKNIIHSAKVASLARRGTEFGLELGSIATNMAGVQDRKRRMVDALIKVHLDRYEASGVELIMGHGRFVAPKTIGITLNAGGERVITADRVVLSLGTRAASPTVPGLVDASPMTHVAGARSRTRPTSPCRHRRRLCRSRTDAGHSPFWFARHGDRERPAAREPRRSPMSALRFSNCFATRASR